MRRDQWNHPSGSYEDAHQQDTVADISIGRRFRVSEPFNDSMFRHARALCKGIISPTSSKSATEKEEA